MKHVSLVFLWLFAVVSLTYSQIPTDGLVGYWPLDGNAQDESGNNHHGTVYGAVLTADRFGNANSAYYFDGTDDYIAITPSSLVVNEASITVSCWIKSENLDISGLPVHTGNQGHYGVHVKRDSVKVGIHTNSDYDGSPPTSFGTAWVYFDQEKWTHVVLRYDGASLQIYVDNVLKDEIFAEGLIWSAQSSYLAFGVYMLNGNPNHGYYQGALDDVRLYRSALSEENITDLFHENLCFETIYDTITTEIFDTTYVEIYDTVTIEVFDTTYVEIYDTIPVYDSISVTDTLIIDAVLTGIDPPDNINTLKVYPNPAKDHIFIHTGDYTLMDGYRLVIIDQLGAVVFETLVNTQLYEVNLSDWSGLGIYYIQVIDTGGGMIDIRKIILE